MIPGLPFLFIERGGPGGVDPRPPAPVSTIACALPGLDVAAIRHCCEQRVPPHAPHQVRSELVLSGGAATIVERRAPWREDFGPEWTSRGVARLRYTAKTGLWTLFYATATAGGIATT